MLKNMVSPTEMIDEGLKEEVALECEKYGKVLVFLNFFHLG